jgi:hypothetical protein
MFTLIDIVLKFFNSIFKVSRNIDRNIKQEDKDFRPIILPGILCAFAILYLLTSVLLATINLDKIKFAFPKQDKLAPIILNFESSGFYTFHLIQQLRYLKKNTVLVDILHKNQSVIHHFEKDFHFKKVIRAKLGEGAQRKSKLKTTFSLTSPGEYAIALINTKPKNVASKSYITIKRKMGNPAIHWRFGLITLILSIVIYIGRKKFASLLNGKIDQKKLTIGLAALYFFLFIFI